MRNTVSVDIRRKAAQNLRTEPACRDRIDNGQRIAKEISHTFSMNSVYPQVPFLPVHCMCDNRNNKIFILSTLSIRPTNFPFRCQWDTCEVKVGDLFCYAKELRNSIHLQGKFKACSRCVT